MRKPSISKQIFDALTLRPHTNEELSEQYSLDYTREMRKLKKRGSYIDCDPVEGQPGVFLYTLRATEHPEWDVPIVLKHKDGGPIIYTATVRIRAQDARRARDVARFALQVEVGVAARTR